MKIEMDDHTCVVSTITLVGAILATIILGCCYMCQQTNREFIKAGLVQKQCIGSCGTYWSKP